MLAHIFAWETLVVVDDESRENAFRINSGASSFVVIAKDAQDKQEWMNSFAQVGLAGRQFSSPLPQAPVWLPDTKECMLCAKKFSQIRRRHHCRRCGWVVCAYCSPHLRYVAGQGRVKVCNNCVKLSVDGMDELLESEFESSEKQSKKMVKRISSPTLKSVVRKTPRERSGRDSRETKDKESALGTPTISATARTKLQSSNFVAVSPRNLSSSFPGQPQLRSSASSNSISTSTASRSPSLENWSPRTILGVSRAVKVSESENTLKRIDSFQSAVKGPSRSNTDSNISPKEDVDL
jgi:hypothetical protein